jgi:hypothetical protein
MGQFIAIGLMYDAVVSRKEMDKGHITVEELRNEMQQSLSYDMTFYDEEITDEYIVYTLKDDVMKEGLIPFLEVFYPVIQPDEKKEEYTKILKILKSTALDEWFEYAEVRTAEPVFIMDEYAQSRNIHFKKDFGPSVRVSFDFIMLKVGYGKIITEGVYDFFDIFKYCISETFKDYPIAKSISAYITG